MNLTVYIASSYNDTIHVSGYGLLFYEDCLELTRFQNFVENEIIYGSNNVSGELFGVLEALKFAIKNDYKTINICFKYTGIENFIKYKYNDTYKDVVRDYINQYNELSKKIDITFTKVNNYSFLDKNNIKICNKLARNAITHVNINN